MMKNALNQCGRDSQPELICPVTGLRILSRPEWTQQRVSDTLLANFYVTGHYRSAVKLALELSETFTHAPEAFVLGHRVCIDASMRTLSPIEVLSNDSWTIRTPTFSH